MYVSNKGRREGKFPNLAVNNLIGHADFQVKFTAALAAGERVDVANIDLINVPYYAAIGALEDMTDFLKSQPYYDQLNGPMLALGSYDGTHFAAPNAADASDVTAALLHSLGSPFASISYFVITLLSEILLNQNMMSLILG